MIDIAHAKGEFILSADEVAANIIRDHGPDCDTYRTAQDYFVSLAQLKKEQCQEDADFLCTPGNFGWFEGYLQYNDDIDTTEIDDEFPSLFVRRLLNHTAA